MSIFATAICTLSRANTRFRSLIVQIAWMTSHQPKVSIH